MQIITTTRNRPKAFEALKAWVKKQELQDYEWLIVCDGGAEDYVFPRSSGSAKVKVVKRDPSDDTMPSLCHNWLTALEHVSHDKCVVLEDDDWYHPMYLSEMSKMLDRADLAGFSHDAYYHVLERKAQRRHNIDLAALAATGFRKNVVSFLKEVASKGDIHMDLILWHEYKGKKLLVNNFTGIDTNSRSQPRLDDKGNILGERPRHVGIKQNWHGGEDGLTQATSGGGIDQTGKVLRAWLAEDAAFYLKFTKEPDTNKPQPFILMEMPIT